MITIDKDVPIPPVDRGDNRGDRGQKRGKTYRGQNSEQRDLGFWGGANLSPRAITILVDNDIKSYLDLQDFLKNPNNTPRELRGCGKKVYAELCKYANLQGIGNKK